MNTARLVLTAAALASTASFLVGCAAASPAGGGQGESRPSQSATPAAATDGTPAVAGYAVGDFPPVPLFLLPDLSLLDDAVGGFSLQVEQELPSLPGVRVARAACGDAIERADGTGTTRLYGDGSGSYTGPDGTEHNYGDGSGSYEIGDVSVSVYGDGSGSYVGPGAEVHNYGDGSGSSRVGSVTVRVFGDGSASRIDTAAGLEHWNYGDGSAMYQDADVEIHNYGDGSGSYAADGIEIVNYGDGTGVVNGTAIAVDPIAPEQPVGVFPPMGVLEPIASCGTTITLEDSVLFDFDRSDLRAEASASLDALAAAMAALGVPSAEIGGHTDAIGTDAYNQALSEKRAASVVAALRARNVSAALTAVGYGESAPVAPDSVDGHDNPAGRQLNRRVEIFIPNF